jgi:hypothetical protein
MGISTQKQKQTVNQTTTPQTPAFISQPIQGFTGAIQNFGAQDPHSFVAPASPLQQQAFSQAGSLGVEQPIINNAITMAQNAAGTQVAPITAHNASTATWNAPDLGPANQAAWSALPNAHNVNAESLLSNLQAYMNPYTTNVVNSTLANYDHTTGEQAAQLAAQQARTGAFGGSRAGIAQGEFQADAGRNRAQTEYGIRADAFNTGAQLSADDANRRQQAGTFNANAGNVRDLTNGQMYQQNQQFNAGALNDFAQAQAAMRAQAAGQNAAAANQTSMFNAGAANTADEFNAGLTADQANRALQAAGLVGNLGVQSGDAARGNLALTADLGTQQRAIDSAYLGAPLTQLQAEGQLYGQIPYSAFVGQNMNGTTVTKSDPGLFNAFLALQQTAAGTAKSIAAFQ